jgi:ABC-type dipeptide/oligopeptide/nickel transport system permease component
VPLAINARLTRSAMIETMRQDFIRTARAKGVREIGVILRHGLRNALIPIVTLVGVQLGTLMSGAIVIETVFAWPGIGRLVVQAIDWRDYPLIQASVLCFTVLFVVLNIVIDVIYGLVDPRIGYE